jgi:hypothetical protein
MMPTSMATVVELSPLLDRLTEATTALRRSRDRVPDEVIDLVDNLDTELHINNPRSLAADPDLVADLFGAAFRADKALRRHSESEQRRDLRVPLEQIRVLLTQITEEAPYAADVPAVDVLRGLVRMLEGRPRELAELLGVSTRTLQRWLADGAAGPTGDEASVVRLVAQVVNQLRYTLTSTAIVNWFQRIHPWLGSAPIELLGDPERHRDLLVAARGIRSAP